MDEASARLTTPVVDLDIATLTVLEEYLDCFNGVLVVVSHDDSDDPVFNYATKAALELWDMEWDEFTATPSRPQSAAFFRDARCNGMFGEEAAAADMDSSLSFSLSLSPLASLLSLYC